MNAKEIAKQILARYAAVGGAVTHITLQKLLFYTKGWSLGLLGKAAFTNAIHAWDWGPVAPSVYPIYQAFGKFNIDFSEDVEIVPDQLLDAVVRVYGQLGPFELSDLTHYEAPWRDTYVEGQKDIRIPDDLIQSYFAGPARRQEIHLHFLDVYGDMRLGVVYRFPRDPISPEREEELLKRISPA